VKFDLVTNYSITGKLNLILKHPIIYLQHIFFWRFEAETLAMGQWRMCWRNCGKTK